MGFFSVYITFILNSIVILDMNHILYIKYTIAEPQLRFSQKLSMDVPKYESWVLRISFMTFSLFEVVLNINVSD